LFSPLITDKKVALFVRLFLLFTLVPLADLVLLLMIGKTIPVWTTVLIIVGTGLTGAWLAKRQWSRVKSRIQNRLQLNQMPGELITDGMLILLAGGLLVAPGLITDAFGISLLIPVCRTWYKKRGIAYLKDHFNVKVFTPPTSMGGASDDVVDGELADPPEPHNDSDDSQFESSPLTIEGAARPDITNDSSTS